MSDLVNDIDQALAETLNRLAASRAWRTYSGPEQERLTEMLQTTTGCSHLGLCSSGSAALESLLVACQLKPGEEVMIAGYDYPGTFAAIERAGGRPVLIDIVADSWNLSVEALDRGFSPDCRVLVVSHLHGMLQPIGEIEAWCRSRGVRLIQDACQALGATIGGKRLGDFGDGLVVSFGGSKVMSAGRGGAWATRDPVLAQHARVFSGLGSGIYEMSEVQAALVSAQLPFLQRITRHCHRYFSNLAEKLAGSCPKAVAPWKLLSSTAFYQAGWLLDSGIDQSSIHQTMADQSSAQQNANPALRTKAMGTSAIGIGFSGFHRRSQRRCRIPGPLTNVARIAQTTLTVHYRAALDDAPIADELTCFFLAACGSDRSRPDESE